MNKVVEYRERAAECRRLAAGMQPDHRDRLLKVAETLEQIANERAGLLRETPGADPEA